MTASLLALIMMVSETTTTFAVAVEPASQKKISPSCLPETGQQQRPTQMTKSLQMKNSST